MEYCHEVRCALRVWLLLCSITGKVLCARTKFEVRCAPKNLVTFVFDNRWNIVCSKKKT